MLYFLEVELLDQRVALEFHALDEIFTFYSFGV